jgi:hypothetical protein
MPESTRPESPSGWRFKFGLWVIVAVTSLLIAGIRYWRSADVYVLALAGFVVGVLGAARTYVTRRPK